MRRLKILIRIPQFLLTLVLVVGIAFSYVYVAYATAPNPGHNFTEVGGGAVQGDILYASGADTLAALEKNTTASRYLSNSGASNNPAWAQVDLSNGVTGQLPIGNGGTGQASAAAARGSSGLNIDQMTTVGDANYTILATDRTVQTNAAFTAPRTWTLPAASALNAGQSICFFDKQGTLTTSNTLTVSRAGSDTINGGTSVTRNTAYMGFCVYSDGVSKWSMPVEGEASGGTGQTTYTTGDMLYANTTNNLAKLADVAAGSYLRSGGVGAAPVWSTPTLPNAAGTSGNILQSDGTNFVSATGGVLLGRQTLTSGTTYTPTTGTTKVLIRMWGGGGAGGGCSAVAGCAGGGGGSGGYAEYYITGVTGTYAYVIGTAGTGVSGAAGGNGGNTTFTNGATTVTAFGGTGGSFTAGTAAIKFMPGGAGGVISTNGLVNGAGAPGQPGMTSTVNTVVMSGNGGATSLGGAGVGRNTTGAGNAAVANTGSGGGGTAAAAATANAGGNGAAGAIIVWEFR